MALVSVVVVAAVVTACLLYMSSPVSAQGTTCGVGQQCASCSGDKVNTLRFQSGNSAQVCCPNCKSRFFNFGVSPRGPYCNCNVDRVTGTARKGEECSASGMTRYFALNTMPICCPDPLVGVRVLPNDANGNFIFNCESRGDCWRGSQCSGCNQSFVGSINGVNVCCSNCEERGLIIGSGSSCSCNRG